MKSDLNIFAYRSYRLFIVDWLKINGYSYRSFVAQHPGLVSLIALAKLLSRGRAGQRETSDYRMAPETLAKLGKALKLSEPELRHFLLLRLENDAEPGQGAHAGAYQKVIRGLLEESRRQHLAGPGVKKGSPASDKSSPTAQQVTELFDLLPSRFRVRILDEILQQGRIFAARQSGKPGVNTVHKLLQGLNTLKDSGAP